jgi:hypothetical protein
MKSRSNVPIASISAANQRRDATLTRIGDNPLHATR